jgi:1,4-dihydroxy-2-naphthoyl-CoA hydrolase
MEELFKGTLMETLEIETIELQADRVIMRMPVSAKTKQPAGLLHGGASVALAESAASMGTYANIDRSKETAVGIEINANHIRSAKDGFVTATATPVHKGRTTMVWDIRIVNDEGKLVCISRCTVGIRPLS